MWKFTSPVLKMVDTKVCVSEMSDYKFDTLAIHDEFIEAMNKARKKYRVQRKGYCPDKCKGGETVENTK
jgi:hypothetical protein